MSPGGIVIARNKDGEFETSQKNQITFFARKSRSSVYNVHICVATCEDANCKSTEQSGNKDNVFPNIQR